MNLARERGDNMILTKWQDFKTDSEHYTQSSFEKQINDQFKAMHFEADQEFPSYIWTDHYVVIVKNNTRMINDVSFIKIPRHPESI